MVVEKMRKPDKFLSTNVPITFELCCVVNNRIHACDFLGCFHFHFYFLIGFRMFSLRHNFLAMQISVLM